jgi:hypothetical protein
MFKTAILSVLGDFIVDAYVPLQTGKEMWNVLEVKYEVSDDGSELYVIEQFHDCMMVDNRSIIEQAYEIQTLTKELEIFGCVLPYKFIIAKLPQAWTDFATSLKHKSQEFNIADLIGSLDIEENARAKNVRGKKTIEDGSSAHVLQKNPQNSYKKKFQPELNQKNTAPFKKKKNKKMEIVSLVANIILSIARMASGSLRRNLQTWLRLMEEHRGMVIYYL